VRSHFRTDGDVVVASLLPDERRFLSDVVPLLVSIRPNDPAGSRLRSPVYREDEEANEEWWRLMGPELAESRSADRRTFNRLVEAAGDVDLDDSEADAVLRVLNEARLVLGSRLGVEVEADYEKLSEEGRWVLDFLALLQEELMDEQARRL
jgi:hypothetical protein